jgi:catalase
MPKKILATEYPPLDENEKILDLAERLKAKITADNVGGIMRRDAHPKMHGVVKAEFIVDSDLPAELRVGLFAQPGVYQAWIRFSNQNSSIQPDIKADIRGMAIKVMGVPGEKILPDPALARTQDFILISTNVFVTADAAQFDGLIRALTGNALSIACFFLLHPRALWNLYKSMITFANPLQIRYFSTTPYRFGVAASVKYSARPSIAVPDEIPQSPADDFLRDAMVKQLDKGGAVFDFMVQFQTDADTMPIEDPGKAWPEAVSPFRKVATVRIAEQEFDSQQQREFGENLSFSPWHALPDHRPLGGINRARRIVYETISAFRHRCNMIAPHEPDSWKI